MKHTPGEWTIVASLHGRSATKTSVVAMQGGSIIKVADTFTRNIPVAEANAHLIAAAPEMLEALKFAKGCLQDAVLFGAATTVDAAIARAEGR